MARSSYVYTVQRYGSVVAAFTVKHELISWLHWQERQHPHDFQVAHTVLRMSDGGYNGLPQALSIQELMSGR